MFFTLFYLLVQIFSRCNGFDPDIDICENPVLSAAVVADDGISYIFKGKYFWKTKNLINDSGIVGFGSPTVQKWPDINDDIRASFVTKAGGKMMTVFIVKDKWFGYEKDVKVLHGSTFGWPQFNNLKISTTFAADYGSSKVFIVHNQNNNYVLYNFADLSKPKVERSGKATVRDKFLWFLDVESGHRSGSGYRRVSSTLKDLMVVTAGLTYSNQLLLLAKDSYCVIKLSSEVYEKECAVKTDKLLTKLLKCPIDVTNRPSTKSQTQISESTQNPNSNPISIQSDITLPIKDSVTDGPQQTEIPVTPVSGKNPESEAGVGVTTLATFNNENSTFWAITFIISFIVMTIILSVMIEVVSKTKNKKKKGSVVLIK